MDQSATKAGRPTRRSALLGGGATLLLASVAACELSPAESDGSAGSDPAKATDKGAEAPMLADRVKAGELPEVGERLPGEPLVIEPTESIGTYGGTWRAWMEGQAAGHRFVVMIGYDNLVRWDPEWTEVIPNLAEWEISADGSEYTFRLREGVKWSDGTPFTADDIVFAYDDVVNNSDLSPVPPAIFVVDGKAAELEKVDEHTVRFTFAAPNGLFLQELAGPAEHLLLPRHYLEEFHRDYNDGVDALVADGGYADWIELFGAKNDLWTNPERPVLNAWQLIQSVGEGSRALFERNPYYWKVDPDGSQLPYLDEVTYELLGDVEVALLKTTNGELDFNYSKITDELLTAGNKPIIAASRSDGGYRFVDGVSSSMNHMVIAFNLAHENQALRDVFTNRDFRIGLSYAINRDELINAVFQRQGEPWQAAPREESDLFNEELAKQYTEYDPDLANEHLDRAGYTDRDGDNFRLRPDGKRISFQVEVSTDKPDQIDALELIREHWAAVGVEMRVRTMERSLFYERKGGNLHDANVWGGDGGLADALLEPRWYFPSKGESNFAIPWATWYMSGGAAGQEPPEAARRQMELYDRVRSTVDNAEQLDFFGQLLDIAQEEFWVIGTVLKTVTYGTVRDTFHNVPEWMPSSWLYPTPGPTRPEQYWTEA